MGSPLTPTKTIDSIWNICFHLFSIPRLSSICDGLVFGKPIFDHGVPRPEPAWRSLVERAAISDTRCSTPLPRGADIITGAFPRRGLSIVDFVVEETG